MRVRQTTFLLTAAAIGQTVQASQGGLSPPILEFKRAFEQWLMVGCLTLLVFLLLSAAAVFAFRELKKVNAVLSSHKFCLAERVIFALLVGVLIFNAYPTSAEKRGSGGSASANQAREQNRSEGTDNISIWMGIYRNKVLSHIAI